MDDVNIEAVEKLLESLPFVQWDRFTRAPWEGAPLVVFGWIARETDARSDFLVVEIDPTGTPQACTTSSSIKSEEIATILFGESNDHTDCIRVEEFFGSPNVIHLK
jgi:hypothetical protein